MHVPPPKKFDPYITAIVRECRKNIPRITVVGQGCLPCVVSKFEDVSRSWFLEVKKINHIELIIEGTKVVFISTAKAARRDDLPLPVFFL